MIQYIIAAGIGAFLGSQSKKSKKSYAEGGIAYVNDDFPELVDSQTYVIDGTYGSNQTPTEVYVMELEGGGKWYAARDSVNVNYTNDSFYDGVDIETISDIDTITASKPIEYSDDLEDLIVRHYGEMLEERGDDYYAKGGEVTIPYGSFNVGINREIDGYSASVLPYDVSENQAKEIANTINGMIVNSAKAEISLPFAKGGSVGDKHEILVYYGQKPTRAFMSKDYSEDEAYEKFIDIRSENIKENDVVLLKNDEEIDYYDSTQDRLEDEDFEEDYAKGGKMHDLSTQEGRDNYAKSMSKSNPYQAKRKYDKMGNFLGYYAKGGKMQGYNARGDEELGMTDGKESRFKQSKKDRRDEMKGENRSARNKTYGSF